MAPSAMFWRRHPDSSRGIRVLQTLALPLGYAAILKRGLRIEKVYSRVATVAATVRSSKRRTSALTKSSEMRA